MHYLDKLADLKKQSDAGIITQAEFDTMKASILEEKDPTIIPEPERGAIKLYFSTWKKMFRIKGRANRSEAWLFSLINSFISSLIGFCYIAFFTEHFMSTLFDESSILSEIASFVFVIAVFIASITLWIRRFHDFNKSGLFSLVPHIIFLISIPLVFVFIGFIGFAIGGILFFIWSLMYCFRSGSKGGNLYGPMPRTKRSVIYINWTLLIASIALTVASYAKVYSLKDELIAKTLSLQAQINEEFTFDEEIDFAPTELGTKTEMSKGLNDRPSLTFEEMNALGQQEGDELNGYALEEAPQETKASEEPATEPTAETATETPAVEPTAETPATETPATEPATETPATETPTAAPISQEPADIMQEAEKFFKNEAQGSVEEAKKDLSDVLTAVADENKAQQPVEFATETQDELEKEAQEIEAFLNTSTVDGTSTSETNIELNTSNILAK